MKFFFVSPELCSEKDYVITHSVHSMYIVCGIFFFKIDHCIHIHWCIPMGLGHNDPWVESHMWPQQTWGQRSSKGHCIHILWFIFMGLGYNDPWRESHMWPQQTWDQRSSRGQWPLVQVFEKRSLYPHTFMYFHEAWLQLSLGRVTHVTSKDLGQRSSWGQWSLVQVFYKTVTVSSYFDVFSWDLVTMILG